jgi:hypothetical protein
MEIDQSVGDLSVQHFRIMAQLAHGTSHKDEPPIASQCSRSGDDRTERLGVGIVTIIEDGKPAFLEQLPASTRYGESLQRGPSGRRIDPELLSHCPDPNGVVGLMQSTSGKREAATREGYDWASRVVQLYSIGNQLRIS